MTNLSYVSPNAILGENVKIDPFVTIHDGVKIGDNCHIMSSVTIFSNSEIGNNCTIFPSAVIGAIPQDLKYKGEDTKTIIGNNNVIRECVTIHRGTLAKGATIVGDNNLIMAYCHVAHDCVIGNNVIMSNATQLAGEVQIQDYAIIGGGSLVHQFTLIGRYSMIQGGTKVNKDVPPFVIAARDPIAFSGINAVGLKRKNFTREQIDNIQAAYRFVFQTGLNTSMAIENLEREFSGNPEIEEIISFIKNSSRGIIKGFL